MSKIVAVRRSSSSEILEVKLDDGNILSVEEAIKLAEQGELEGVSLGYAGRGEFKHRTLRSFPDGDKANNLKNLPQF